MNQSTQILYRIVDTLFRYRWLFLLSMVGVIAAAGGILYVLPESYRAEAATRIVTDDTDDAVGITSSTRRESSWAQQNVDRFNDLTTDDKPGGFLDAALKKSKLTPPINVDSRVRDPRYSLFRKRLQAWTNSASIFTISLTWADPNEAQQIVKALQEQYVEAVSLGQQARAAASERFLEGQIREYAARMFQAEESLTVFKQDNQGYSPEEQDALLDRITALRTQLDSLRITAQDSTLRRGAVEQQLALMSPRVTEETTEAVPTGAGGGGEDPVTARLRDLETRRDALLQQYAPTSSIIRDLEGEIATVRAAVPTKVARPTPTEPPTVRHTTVRGNPEYNALSFTLTESKIQERTQQAQITLAEQKIAELEARMKKMPAAQRELTAKMRDYDILRLQYERLVERREQAKIKSDLDRVSARSIFSPIGTIHARPTTSMKMMFFLLIGTLVLGCALGGGLVFFREWVDPSLRYGEDAERLLGLPILASLPEAGSALSPGSDAGGGRARRRALPPASTPSQETGWAPDLGNTGK